MIDRLNLNSWRTSVTRPDNSFRMFHISILAAIIGIVAGLVAYALFTLIGLLWNLVFFQQVSTELTDLDSNPIGLWVFLHIPQFSTVTSYSLGEGVPGRVTSSCTIASMSMG